MTRRLLIVTLTLALAGCSGSSAPSVSVRPLGVGEQWLKVADWSGSACGGTGLVGDYRLHGSATDPHLVWMTDPDGSRHELAWNPGTSARFTPSLEVVGPNGEVMAREGWFVAGHCLVGTTGFAYVELRSPPPEEQPTLTAEPPLATATPSISPSASASGSSRLRVAPADLGCDSIGVPYRSARIHIDGAAADPVTAVGDDGSKLRTYWSAGFTLGLAPTAVADWQVRDPSGQNVAGEGEVIDIPDGAWPRLHGYFVCPSPDALYVLLKDPV